MLLKLINKIRDRCVSIIWMALRFRLNCRVNGFVTNLLNNLSLCVWICEHVWVYCQCVRVCSSSVISVFQSLGCPFSSNAIECVYLRGVFAFYAIFLYSFFSFCFSYLTSEFYSIRLNFWCHFFATQIKFQFSSPHKMMTFPYSFS